MVGVGNMGGAVLSGVLDAGLVPATEIGVVDLDPDRRALFAKRGCQVSEDLGSLAGAKTRSLRSSLGWSRTLRPRLVRPMNGW